MRRVRGVRTFLVLGQEDGDEDEDDEVIHTHTHHHYHHPHDGEKSHVGTTVHANPALAAIQGRMESPPPTWSAYAGRADAAAAIIEMEYQELLVARASGSSSQIKKELTDLAAACAHALKEL